jgi:hypothetical protein
MADIQVTSETTNDASQFLQSLAQEQQALDAFANYANNLKIAPQFTIDAAAITTSFRAVLQQMVTDAQTQGSAMSLALTQQLSNIPVTLNLTAAQTQIQNLLAGVQNITLMFNAPSAIQIGTDIGNAAASALQAAIAGIRWPAPPSPGPHPSPGGGGGGGGMGRAAFGTYMMRRVANAMRGLGEAEAQEAMATTPQEHFSAAEHSYMATNRLIESIPVYGPIAAAVSEVAFAPIQIQSKLIAAEAKAQTQFEESRQQALEQNMQGQARLDIGETGGMQKALLQAKEARRHKDVEIQADAAKARDEAAKLNQLDESQNTGVFGSESWLFGGNGAAGRRELATQRQRIIDKETADRKQQADAEQKQAEEKAARENVAANEQNGLQVNALQSSTTGIQLALSGQTRASKDFNIQSQLDAKLAGIQAKINKATAEGDNEEVGRLQNLYTAQQAENVAKLAQNKQEGDIQERSQTVESTDRISDTYNKLKITTLKTAGQTTEAGNVEFVQQQDNIVRKLQEQLAVTTDLVKQDQIRKELAAAIYAHDVEIADHQKTQLRTEAQEIEGITNKTEQYQLKAEGRNYEAGRLAITQRYDDEIREAQRNGPQGARKATALQAEEGAELAAYERPFELKKKDIEEQTKELQEKNANNFKAAYAHHINYAALKAIDEAAGNPAMQEDIIANQIAQSQARVKGAILHPENMRSAFDMLMKAANDPEMASNKEAEERLQKKLRLEQDNLKHGLNPDGSPLSPPQAKHDPANLNAMAMGAINDAAKKIGEAAQKILDAPPIFLIGWQ